jgi:hypothetical protein
MEAYLSNGETSRLLRGIELTDPTNKIGMEYASPNEDQQKNV